MEPLIGAYVIFVVPWLLVGWFRIPRYVRYLQENEYNAPVYLRWLTSNKAENRYIQIFITLFIILVVISCCSSIYLPRIIYNSPFAITMVNLGLLIPAIIFAPHRFPQQKILTFSWRQIRLIVIGFFVELVPIFASLGVCGQIYALISDPNNSAESMILAFGFVTLMILLIMIIGPLTLILTPYNILLTQRINSIVELLISMSICISQSVFS